jgi:hypothetical protein
MPALMFGLDGRLALGIFARGDSLLRPSTNLFGRAGRFGEWPRCFKLSAYIAVEASLKTAERGVAEAVGVYGVLDGLDPCAAAICSCASELARFTLISSFLIADTKLGICDSVSE